MTDKLEINRLYTDGKTHPYDMVKWMKRTATIRSPDSKVVFEQKDVEFPEFWSDTAVSIVSQKYFRGHDTKREKSLKQLIDRVIDTITEFGQKNKYFNKEEAQIFSDELKYMVVNQIMAFNSPVWFNVGYVKEEKDGKKAQSSACFLLTCQDDMESILDWYKLEGLIFKGGSGSGINLSPLRGKGENLSKGGISSGPVSFMRGADSIAGAIKSGGSTRRSAKIIVLNVDHPDIEEFVWCKAKEEEKAYALGREGYDISLNGEVWQSIQFQNANNSVRVTDEFMKAVEIDGNWDLIARTDEKVVKTVKAKKLFEDICKAAWQCGDPGLQFDDTIQKWYTTPNKYGKNTTTNPCVTGDTRILTKDGRWKRIDSFTNKKEEVHINNPLLLYSHINGSFKTGIKEVYRLTTKSGYELKATNDHPILTKEQKFVPISALTINDYISLVFPNVSSIEKIEEGEKIFYQLVGLIYGDGYYNGNMFMVTMNKETERKILQKFEKYINSIKKNKRNTEVHILETTTSIRLSIGNKEIIEKFRNYITTELQPNRRFTNKIFELPIKYQKYVLQGLFTADGTVANYGESSQYIALDSSSLQLLKDVQILLIGFGIKSKIYKNRRNGKDLYKLPDGHGGLKLYKVKEMHSLRISKKSRIIFENLIGFIEESEKNIKLRKLNNEVSTYAEKYFDKVEKIEKLGEEEVYDVTEPITHTFIANGIVVHNCGEYIHADFSACNLSSLNLLKFDNPDNDVLKFDWNTFAHAVQTTIIAQDILVDLSGYPDTIIEKNTHELRQLGLGYTNLGALVMSRGFPYDSEEARELAATVTGNLTGFAYKTSALLAEKLGPFDGYKENKKEMLKVLKQHAEEQSAEKYGLMVWSEVLELAEKHGVRNSQVSVIAPTGTISFLLDADTTGLEPELALIKYKALVGTTGSSGVLKLISKTLPHTLKTLEYDDETIAKIIQYVNDNETIEDCPLLDPQYLPIFDCSFKSNKGKRFIRPEAHVLMLASIQPMVSGGMSKSCNLPESATVEDVAKIYMLAWKTGVKCISIYRDKSKAVQPLTTRLEDKKPKTFLAERHRLPIDRASETHKFSVGGYEGYLIVGLYENGKPGETFIKISKEGSTVSGLFDVIAALVSIALQYGIPLKKLVEKFVNVKFEPSGITGNPKVPFARSIVDYIFRHLAFRYLSNNELSDLKLTKLAEDKKEVVLEDNNNNLEQSELVGVPCQSCGNMMSRRGACWVCEACGDTSGCG